MCKPKSTQSNDCVWYHLGLTKSMSSMLETLALPDRVFIKKSNKFCVAGALLNAALAHFDVLSPLMRQDASYAQAEGFNNIYFYRKRLIENQHAKISNANRQRRKKTK